MEQQKFQAVLLKKLEILGRICANAATQSRFIHRRETTGLRRLLREQARLMDELAGIDRELKGSGDRVIPAVLRPIMQEIEIKQEQIAALSQQALEDAVKERNNLMAELNHVRIMRRLKNRYESRTGIGGSRLNLKG